MRPYLRHCLVTLFLLTPSVAIGGGFVNNANFIVIAPDKELADKTLEMAEHYRSELALKWFGEKLPEGTGRTLISIVFSNGFRHASFWPIDRPERKLHKLQLNNYRNQELHAVLAHEITHLLMEIRFKGALPIWTNEGLATLQDEAESRLRLTGVMQNIARAKERPPLTALLKAVRIHEYDPQSYALSSSFTAFLLEVGSARCLFEFALRGRKHGWEAAAKSVYSCDLGRLEHRWYKWVEDRLASKRPYAVVGASRDTVPMEPECPLAVTDDKPLLSSEPSASIVLK